MNPEKSNGREQRISVLLYINTVLTALILPLLGFIGVRLWDQVDSNAKEIASIRYELAIVKERQSRVLEEIPKLIESDRQLRKTLEEHESKTEARFNKP